MKLSEHNGQYHLIGQLQQSFDSIGHFDRDLLRIRKRFSQNVFQVLLVLLGLLRCVFGHDGEQQFLVGTCLGQLGGLVKHF